MLRGRNDPVVKIGIVAGLAAAVAVVIASATFGANEAAGPSAGSAPAAKPGRAVVALADNSPLRLRGTRFQPGERVRVTVDDGSGEQRKLVTASAAGTFVVSFAGVEACSLEVSATGDEGSRASFQFSSFVC